jgi:uncharacterized membrane protein
MDSRADEVPIPELPDVILPEKTSDYITSVAHYYRGELSRMITWRDRLDHTTNWAIAATAAMLSVALSSPSSHHGVILCAMLLVFLLLRIEARRYLYFDVSRRRARLLEQNYYARLFVRGESEVQPDWRGTLSANLRFPRFNLSLLQAIRIRLRRNYIWIYLTLLVSWWLKVSTVVLNAQTGEARFVSGGQLLRNASVSYIPGALVIAGVLLFYGWLLVMSLSRPSGPVDTGGEEIDV